MVMIAERAAMRVMVCSPGGHKGRLKPAPTSTCFGLGPWASYLLEQHRRHVVQMMTPHHPLMPPVGQLELVIDAFRRERRVQRLGAGADQSVILADADPQQLDLF